MSTINVGLTYDLRSYYRSEGFSELETAEFDREDTIDAIEQTLQQLGFITDRIGHARNLISRLVSGDQWDLVFNIAEGLRGYGREATVPAILDLYGIPYTFSDPMVLALTLHKGVTKRIIRDLGIPTQPFEVVTNEMELLTVDLPFPLFVKPVAEGTGKGITSSSKVHTQEQLSIACRMIWREFDQPALVETFLCGREFTVGVIGSGSEAQAIGVMEVKLLSGAEREVYSYHNKEYCEELVQYLLAEGPEADKAKEFALAAWRWLGCRDAGRVDFRSDGNGIPNFLEVNPLAGIHPEHSDLPIICSLTGISYQELIEHIMTSALKRVNS